MVNDNRRNKDIAEIKKLNMQLHKQAANVPACDPFTPEGSQVWTEWSEGCREIEGALREAGEDF